MILPPTSVRGPIRSFIERHAASLGDNVLECGSLLPDASAWWANNRGFAQGKWLGIDIAHGHNVDRVADIEALPEEWLGEFSGVLCSEVLEHVRRPARALAEIFRVLRGQGVAVFTTLTAFPIHGYPDDYRRWTSAGLRIDLEDAGFRHIVTEYAGSVEFTLNDHGEAGISRLSCPISVFATAVK